MYVAVKKFQARQALTLIKNNPISQQCEPSYQADNVKKITPQSFRRQMSYIRIHKMEGETTSFLKFTSKFYFFFLSNIIELLPTTEIKLLHSREGVFVLECTCRESKILR